MLSKDENHPERSGGASEDTTEVDVPLRVDKELDDEDREVLEKELAKRLHGQLPEFVEDLNRQFEFGVSVEDIAVDLLGVGEASVDPEDFEVEDLVKSEDFDSGAIEPGEEIQLDWAVNETTSLTRMVDALGSLIKKTQGGIYDVLENAISSQLSVESFETSRGKIDEEATVELRLVRDEDGDRVFIEIADRGPGIGPATLFLKLFGPGISAGDGLYNEFGVGLKASIAFFEWVLRDEGIEPAQSSFQILTTTGQDDPVYLVDGPLSESKHPRVVSNDRWYDWDGQMDLGESGTRVRLECPYNRFRKDVWKEGYQNSNELLWTYAQALREQISVVYAMLLKMANGNDAIPNDTDLDADPVEIIDRMPLTIYYSYRDKCYEQSSNSSEATDMGTQAEQATQVWDAIIPLLPKLRGNEYRDDSDSPQKRNKWTFPITANNSEFTHDSVDYLLTDLQISRWDESHTIQYYRADRYPNGTPLRQNETGQNPGFRTVADNSIMDADIRYYVNGRQVRQQTIPDFSGNKVHNRDNHIKGYVNTLSLDPDADLPLTTNKDDIDVHSSFIERLSEMISSRTPWDLLREDELWGADVGGESELHQELKNRFEDVLRQNGYNTDIELRIAVGDIDVIGEHGESGDIVFGDPSLSLDLNKLSRVTDYAAEIAEQRPQCTIQQIVIIAFEDDVSGRVKRQLNGWNRILPFCIKLVDPVELLREPRLIAEIAERDELLPPGGYDTWDEYSRHQEPVDSIQNIPVINHTCNSK
ncbi:ATP-binding protein [Halorientalis regularis]|uniref:Histidine kinase-, DNA gyrase B-, and HSP90-like ATPase n=1 Tax=Halorientalis regularis TaxID=660518 RepID=A0A1G7GFB5_9EURY|nr:ATP-binding protein [Halorientalis regularis]SDE86791.1 hypothetical protein SAMN05216218_10216 [Halorientalis regularis]